MTDEQNSCKCLLDLTDKLMENFKPYIDEAAKQGWFVFDPFIARYWIGLFTRVMNPERPISPPRFVSLLSRMMRRYYLTEANLDAMKQMWLENEWSKVRWPIFQEAIDCYKRGAYYASVSTGLPLVEGIITFRSQMDPFSGSKYLKARIREIDPSGKLAEIVENLFADTRSLDELVEGALNRHAILHGMDVKFGTQERALQVIGLLNSLVSI